MMGEFIRLATALGTGFIIGFLIVSSILIGNWLTGRICDWINIKNRGDNK